VLLVVYGGLNVTAGALALSGLIQTAGSRSEFKLSAVPSAHADPTGPLSRHGMVRFRRVGQRSVSGRSLVRPPMEVPVGPSSDPTFSLRFRDVERSCGKRISRLQFGQTFESND
jgi:hypothetical protein